MTSDLNNKDNKKQGRRTFIRRCRVQALLLCMLTLWNAPLGAFAAGTPLEETEEKITGQNTDRKETDQKGDKTNASAPSAEEAPESGTKEDRKTLSGDLRTWNFWSYVKGEDNAAPVQKTGVVAFKEDTKEPAADDFLEALAPFHAEEIKKDPDVNEADPGKSTGTDGESGEEDGTAAESTGIESSGKEDPDDPEKASKKEEGQAADENAVSSDEASGKEQDPVLRDRAVLDLVKNVNGYALWNAKLTLSEKAMEELKEADAAYKDEGLSYSFCLLDIKTGRMLTCNTGLSVYSASAIKAPYIVSCLEAGKEAERDMYLAGHISDNDAYRRLREKYGDGIFESWLSDTGCDASLAEGRYTHLTAMDLTRMWLKMYAYIVSDEEGSSFAKMTFEHSAYSALDETFGYSDEVCSKAGWIAEEENPDYNVYNTAGIVMDEESPFILSITSTAHATTGEAAKLAAALGTVHEELAAADN